MRITILAVLVGLHMALCVWTARTGVPRIEADISQRLAEIVAPVPTLSLTVAGRDVAVIGRVRSPGESEAMRVAVAELIASIGALHGVRSVRGEVEIIPTQTGTS